MQIKLNLATRPFADLGPAIKRLRIGMGVLALLAIGFGVGLHLLHRKAEDARENERKVEMRIQAVNREHQAYLNLMQKPENADVLAQATSLNQLFETKAFSWTLAMEDLETVLPGGVQVTTLEPIPDSKTGVITLHLHVIGPRDHAVELVQNLEHSHRFLLPRIVGENAESSGNGNNQQLEPISASSRVNFEVWANYNPATEAERKISRAKPKQVANAAEAAIPSATPMPANKLLPHPVQSPPLPFSRPVPPAVANPMPMGNNSNLRRVYTPAPDQPGLRNRPMPNQGGTPQ
jgi:type IV pilus assembly protein PilN